MSRPWPSEKPRRSAPLPALVLLCVAGICSLVLIAGVVMTMVAPPSGEAARVFAGDELFSQGDVEGALAAWQAELDARPTAELWSRVGIGEIARDRGDAAREAFDRALALDPDRVDALANLARIEAPTNLPSALSRLEHAQSIEPNRPGIRLVRGQILLGHGEVELARTEFVEELNVNPASARAWLELRRCDEIEKEQREGDAP